MVRRLRDTLIGLFALFHILVLLTMAQKPIEFEGSLAPVTVAWKSWFEGMKPVARLYGENFGAKQYGWSMFSTVGTRNSRVIIDARRGGEWGVLFEESAGGWRSTSFRYYRWLELFVNFHGRSKPIRTFRRFTNWAADEIFAEFDDVCAVRVRVVRGRTLSPEQLEEGRRRRYKPFVESKVIERAGGCP